MLLGDNEFGCGPWRLLGWGCILRLIGCLDGVLVGDFYRRVGLAWSVLSVELERMFGCPILVEVGWLGSRGGYPGQRVVVVGLSQPGSGLRQIACRSAKALLIAEGASKVANFVGEGGLEPPRPEGHWHLKPARLPFRHSP